MYLARVSGRSVLTHIGNVKCQSTKRHDGNKQPRAQETGAWLALCVYSHVRSLLGLEAVPLL